MRASSWVALRWILAFVVIGAVYWLADRLYLTPSNRLDFFVNRRTYERMVAYAKRQHVPINETQTIGVPHGLDTATGEDLLTVSRDKQGSYTIAIVTRDWGHAGMYGYVYSDKSPVPIVGDPYYNAEVRPFATLDQRLSAHWWTASNRLD